MKNKRLWIIPAVFFLMACAVNLYGCILNNLTVERYVKGALMPLLAVTGITWLAQRPFNKRTAGTLLLAQMLGWAGDSLLMGPGFAFFATGLGMFLIGHLCYISIFSRSLRGLRPVAWLIAIVVMAGILVSLVLAIGIKGALLVPMLLYGTALLLIVFCGLCGIFRRVDTGIAHPVWWMILWGGLLFLVSDGLIAMRTFDLAHFELRGFTIMSTYLAAQALLCVAGVRIAVTGKK